MTAETLQRTGTVLPPDDGLHGLTAIDEPRPSIGTMPNAPHQTAVGFMKGAPYELAIVEFDDQGRCYDQRRQMNGVAEALNTLATEREEDVILLVFVHGWKHDARTDDENLSAFRGLLAGTVEHERRTTADGSRPRRVLGIFVGWRGLSEFGLHEAITDATFWERQAAGHRVATGSVRELFGRLRHYRNHRLNRNGSPLLVIGGHSFGGMIVYSALAQSLIEAASAPMGELVPGFADLILLVNPAMEASPYLAVQDLICSDAFTRRTCVQLPVFICAQAENDQPVGRWFPIGNFAHHFEQATVDDLERECVTHALGFVPSFRTHDLSGPVGDDPFVLKSVAGFVQTNPFWVIGAASEVIDGHGGIWQEPFVSFLASVLFQHVQSSKTFDGDDAQPDSRQPANQGPGGAAGGARPMFATSHSQHADLAAFARRIGPISLRRG